MLTITMGQRLESFVACTIQLFIWIPLRILFFFFGRLKVFGWDNIHLLPKGAFIIASNHVSFLDAFLIPDIFPLGKGFFPFRSPIDPLHYYTWKRPFAWMVGAYAVFPKQGLEVTLAKSLTILLYEGRILIFPESKVKRQGRMRGARRGVAYLAAKSGLPILPCFIEGFYPQRYTLGFLWKDLFLRRYHLKVALGKPFYIQELYGKVPETMDDYKKAAGMIMRKVYESA